MCNLAINVTLFGCKLSTYMSQNNHQPAPTVILTSPIHLFLQYIIINCSSIISSTSSNSRSTISISISMGTIVVAVVVVIVLVVAILKGVEIVLVEVVTVISHIVEK